ncbi:hypothetical protein, partial [Pseudomonas syringae group genomosp. 7]|uniref:hypothetical protein n=1 Tax=Pseudomonas syringae group genomosp. 7 TaxID=251699 RepID=UPI0037703C87
WLGFGCCLGGCVGWWGLWWWGLWFLVLGLMAVSERGCCGCGWLSSWLRLRLMLLWLRVLVVGL